LNFISGDNWKRGRIHIGNIIVGKIRNLRNAIRIQPVKSINGFSQKAHLVSKCGRHSAKTCHFIFYIRNIKVCTITDFTDPVSPVQLQLPSFIFHFPRVLGGFGGAQHIRERNPQQDIFRIVNKVIRGNAQPVIGHGNVNTDILFDHRFPGKERIINSGLRISLRQFVS
jgi:hypothetical protein